MKIAAIAFTERGMQLGRQLCAATNEVTLERCGNGMLSGWTEAAFQSADAILFIGAAGIAVRAIAPFIKSKAADPAVIVIDEAGRYAIPLLSGHIGGANDLAIRLGGLMGAQPVITTATDINHTFAIDTWAKKQGLIIAEPERIKNVSSRLLSGDSIGIHSAYPIHGAPPEGVSLQSRPCDADVLISHLADSGSALHLIPPAVTLGIGCRLGSSAHMIEEAFQLALKKSNCHQAAICGVASIDIKQDEPGINEFCVARSLPFSTFSAKELERTQGEFTPSPFVKSVTGVDNVCERAAVLSSGGNLIMSKMAHNGVTMALAIKEPLLYFQEDA